MENLTISTNELLSNVVAEIGKGRDVKILTKGYSMTPTFINEKDYVVLSKVTRKLRVGDIVLYTVGRQNMMVLHRIVKIRKEGKLLIIRGDGNYSPFEHRNAASVKAIVTSGSMFGRRLTFRAESFWFRTYGYLYIWSYPLRWFLLKAWHFAKKTVKKIFK